MKITPAQNTKTALENLIMAMEILLVPQTPPPVPLSTATPSQPPPGTVQR